MGITVETSGGQRIPIEGPSATVGRDPGCAVRFPDDARLLHQHAVLREVSGRWMIEAKGAELPQIGDGPPARVHWLNPGDVVRLTPSGPELTFQPSQRTAMEATPTAGNVGQDRAGRQGARRIPALWTAAAVLVLGALVVVTLLVIGNREQPGAAGKNADRPAPRQAEASGAALSELATVETTDDDGQAEAAPDDKTDVTRALYTVTVGNPDQGPTFQVGTACAVSEHQLLSSAAVALALEAAKEKLPALAVSSPVLKRQFEIVAWTVHPQYRSAAADADRARENDEAAREQLENAADDKEKKQLAQQIAQAAQAFHEATGRQAAYDLAVLEVREVLQDRVPLRIGREARLKVGTRAVLAGLPFAPDDYLVDPESPAMPRKVEARIFALPPVDESPNAARRIVVKLPDGVSKDNWSGSPLLDGAGKLVAVYSRPALLASDSPSASGAHVASSVERLADFAKQLVEAQPEQ